MLLLGNAEQPTELEQRAMFEMTLAQDLKTSLTEIRRWPNADFERWRDLYLARQALQEK